VEELDKYSKKKARIGLKRRNKGENRWGVKPVAEKRKRSDPCFFSDFQVEGRGHPTGQELYSNRKKKGWGSPSTWEAFHEATWLGDVREEMRLRKKKKYSEEEGQDGFLKDLHT